MYGGCNLHFFHFIIPKQLNLTLYKILNININLFKYYKIYIYLTFEFQMNYRYDEKNYGSKSIFQKRKNKK